MDRPIRILLAIPHLGGGGAERVFALLAQHLDPGRFEIHLALLTPDGPGSPTLPPHVLVHRMEKSRVRHALLPLLFLIRTLKPRIVFSGMAHLNFLILLLKPLLPYRTRILIRQNTTASSAAGAWSSRLAYRHLYPRADRILCQSQAMADDLAVIFQISPEKITVLRNPIAPPTRSAIAARERFPSPSPHLLFVGRLSREKGADLLLYAFQEFSRRHPDASLTLLGAGPEEATLRGLAQSLKISHAVEFAGYGDPAPYFARATLFVLASRHEGVPNALLEAAAAGLPIVATPASGGISELLRAAPGCWLAPQITAAALARTLIQALDQLPNLPRRIPHAFVHPYRLDRAVNAYTELLLTEAAPRLVFLIPTLDQIGGAERQVLDLAQQFASRHWQVTLITLSGSGAEVPATLAPRHLSLKMRKAWFDPAGWQRYLRWHRAYRPDMLHAHLPHASFFARLSRLLAPTPVLVDTIHTTAAGPVTRRLSYRLTHFFSDTVTVVSRAVEASVATAGIAPQTVLLANGIRIPEIQPPKTEAAGGSFRWFAVGRLARVKDYPTLLQAFSRLPERATLTIAGSGPSLNRLEALATELGISARVHFLGFRAEIQPLLADADAFVQSSLWEGLPIAVLEASAAALPLLVTNAPGTAESLIPEKTGFLSPIGDVEALAAAMLRLMETPADARRQIGLRGRSFVQSKFSLSGVADRWEQLYLQLLEDAVRSRNPQSLPTMQQAPEITSPGPYLAAAAASPATTSAAPSRSRRTAAAPTP